MRKPIVLLLAIAGSILLIFGIFFLYANSVYTNAVKYQENVEKSWADVESAYQRRSDLIPNLVNTVKGYSEHEQQTLLGVIEARAKATSPTIKVDRLNEASIKQFEAAQTGLTSALQKLMVVVERYPDLKASQNFMELHAQLEGTENRINVERMKYNENVQTYNSHIRGFVKRKALSWLAEPNEFQKATFYEATTANAEVAPDVNF